MKEKNLLFKDFGIFTNTSRGDQYEIKKIVIFKDEQIKIIANYFLDNCRNNFYKFEYYGETTRKLKIDLLSKTNFVVKSEKQDSWHDKTQYDLYINGNINNYNFENITLYNTQLNINYLLNNVKCSQCIGWNEKESNKYKYNKFEEAYKKIHIYSLDSENMEQNIKDLLKAYKNYKKALEIEKTYTWQDYKKMKLVSGTTKEENLTMLKNNGFDIKGLENEK